MRQEPRGGSRPVTGSPLAIIALTISRRDTTAIPLRIDGGVPIRETAAPKGSLRAHNICSFSPCEPRPSVYWKRAICLWVSGFTVSPVGGRGRRQWNGFKAP
jgi:hypothetical protein